MASPILLAASSSAPAGGAALDQVVYATTGVGVVSLLLLGLAIGHRTRRTTVLVRAADWLAARSGRPGWVALPSALGSTSLLVALFGMLWDISLHIGRGRDPGPLANPAHYFILVGLFMVFAAGALAVVLPLDERPGAASVRITRTWRAPVGGLLVAGSGFYALVGFPLDDVWHRLFGQDVTLWGPTHLMLIGGAGLSLVGLLVLEAEGRAAKPEQPGSSEQLVARLLRTSAFGGFLLGMSVFQGEFDFGVPQFRLVFHPALIAGAAGLVLVAARLVTGRGGAVGATAFFLLVRGGLSLVVGPVLGEPRPHFPLYLGSALLVELLGLLPVARRPLAFGALAGLVIGTAGTASEFAWSQVAVVLPWGRDIAVEGTVLAVVMGVAGGVVGALLALGLQGRLPRQAVARAALALSVLAVAVAVGDGLVAPVPHGWTATTQLHQASGPGGRWVTADVRIAPAPRGPSWVMLTAWQGGGLVVDRLRQVGPGQYRSTRPLPVHGDWKALLRVHQGRALVAAPVYLPRDVALGKPELAAAGGTRALGKESLILQREKKADIPGWLWGAASVVVLLCSLALVALLSWGVGRFSRVLAAAPARHPAAARRRTAARPVTA